MSKVTEKSLKNDCLIANSGILKSWSFGLTVERYGDGFMLYKLFRKPSNGQPREERLFPEPLPAKGTKCFIDGFLAAMLASEPFRSSLAELNQHLSTCQKQNSDEWMSTLVENINGSCELLGDSARFQFDGDEVVQK